MHRLDELVRLHRMKKGAHEIARKLKIGPNVERKYRLAFKAEGLLEGPEDELPSLEELRAAVDKHYPKPELPPQQVSSLEPFRQRIEMYLEKRLGPRAIFDRLRLEYADFDKTCFASSPPFPSYRSSLCPGNRIVSVSSARVATHAVRPSPSRNAGLDML